MVCPILVLGGIQRGRRGTEYLSTGIPARFRRVPSGFSVFPDPRFADKTTLISQVRRYGATEYFVTWYLEGTSAPDPKLPGSPSFSLADKDLVGHRPFPVVPLAGLGGCISPA